MSTRYADSVKIGTVWLTRDGSESATPCKVHVPGEQKFASVYAATQKHAADSSVHLQILNRGVKGISFDVVAEFLPESVLASIVTVLNSALAATGTVRVIVSSLHDFDVLATPVFQEGQLFTFDARSGGYARGVRFKFLSTAAGA